MQSTQRTLIIALITAIVGAGIGVGATLLVKNDDNNVAVPSPLVTFSPEATESASPSPSLSPSPTASATAQVSASPQTTSQTSATTTHAPSGSAPATRSAASVSCSSEPQFCSNSADMKVSGGKLSSTSSHPGGHTDKTRYPVITMTTKYEGPNGSTAHTGGNLTQIVVDVVVENQTSNRTFVFPKREVALVLTKNGQKYDTLLTHGDGFEMPPGGKLKAHFERPIIADGNYDWVAKTWYYTKT
jgi:hypothetical protein